MKPWAPKQKGFTIVELLIVIVVIAILAAITIVAYNGIQARAKDTVRKNDLAHLVKVTQLYATDKGDYAEINCGASGSGWLTSDYDGTGPAVSVNTCLISGGYLSKEIRDPSGYTSCGGLTCFAYMKCSGNLGTYYFAHLESLSQVGTETDGTNCSTYDTAYGMNYVAKVN